MHRYENWDGVLDYCRYSANPVGRLVLYLAVTAMPSGSALRCHVHGAATREFLAGRGARPREGPHLYSARFAARAGLTVEDIVARQFR